VQTRSVASLIDRYLRAEIEALSTTPLEDFVRVDWQPEDYARQPGHRGSDLLVITLDGSTCAGEGPFRLRTRYDADVSSHDLSNDLAVSRPVAGAAPTHVFVPVFWQGFMDHSYFRFSGIHVSGAPAACAARVGRVVEAGVPLRIELTVPPDWTERRLFEGIRPPQSLAWFISRPL
jgi:hypothetical protein